MSIAYTIKQLLESGYPATLPPFATQAEMYAFAAMQKRSLSATLIDLMALGMSPLPQFDFTTTTTLDPSIAFSRATTGTRYDTDGLLVTEAANVPRFDFDPVTHAARGLMIEPQRTNLAKDSQNPASATWARDSVTAGAKVLAPTGAADATQILETVDSTYHRARPELVTFAFNAVYTVRFIIAKLGRKDVYLRTAAATGAFVSISFDLDTAAVTFVGDPAYTASATRLPGGFIGLSVSFQRQITGGGSGEMFIGPAAVPPASNSTPAHTGDVTKGLVLFSCSIEQGAFATSYIPTTTATATRAADVAQVTLPQTSDILVQDRAGGAWIAAVPAGLYTLTPRADQRHITRWRAFPAGFAAANAAMAVAY